MDFGTLYSDEKRKKRDSGSSRKRMFCIFLAITAVTALVIWALIPSAKKDLPASAPAATDNGKTATPAGQQETSAQEQTDSGKKMLSGETAGADKQQLSPDPETKTEETVKIAEKQEVSSSVDLPKGVVGPGDIAAQDDKPLIPTEKNTADFALSL